MLRTFFKDSVIYTLPSIVSKGMTLLLIPLYTRVLSPADYGSLDLLLVFISIINLTVALEVSQGVARYYSMASEPLNKVEYASTAFWFTVGCYSLFAVIASVNSEPLSSLVMAREGFGNVFQIAILYIWANGLFYLIQNQFRWELRSKRYAAVSILSAVTTAIVSVWLAYFLGWGLEGLLYGMSAGSIVGVVYGGWHLRQSFILFFSYEKLKKMLGFSMPLIPSGIFLFISMYIDRMMVNHFLTISDVGTYGIAFRIAGIAGLVTIGFQSALTPLVYTYYKDAETPEKLATIFRYFISGALGIFLGLTLFSKEILWLFTTEEYYSAATLIIYMIPAILLTNMYVFFPGIAIVGKTKYILLINAFGAILNVAFNWALIPLVGLEGAALATLLGNLCIFLSYVVLSQSFYSVPHKWRPVLISIVSISLLAIIGVSWKFEQVIIAIIIKASLIVCGVVIIALSGLVSFKEIKKGYKALNINKILKKNK